MPLYVIILTAEYKTNKPPCQCYFHDYQFA